MKKYKVGDFNEGVHYFILLRFTNLKNVRLDALSDFMLKFTIFAVCFKYIYDITLYWNNIHFLVLFLINKIALLFFRFLSFSLSMRVFKKEFLIKNFNIKEQPDFLKI